MATTLSIAFIYTLDVCPSLFGHSFVTLPISAFCAHHLFVPLLFSRAHLLLVLYPQLGTQICRFHSTTPLPTTVPRRTTRRETPDHTHPSQIPACPASCQRLQESETRQPVSPMYSGILGSKVQLRVADFWSGMSGNLPGAYSFVIPASLAIPQPPLLQLWPSNSHVNVVIIGRVTQAARDSSGQAPIRSFSLFFLRLWRSRSLRSSNTGRQTPMSMVWL